MTGLGKLLLTIRKLNNIGRWSNEFLHQRASVAEHSFYVTQIAQLLGYIEEKCGNEINWKSLYQKALNHDVPESLMGDVLSTIKNINEHTKQTLLDVEEYLIDHVLLNEMEEPYHSFYRGMLYDSKDESIEGKILKYSDLIDALIECVQEIRLANEEPFITKYISILKQIEMSDLESVQYFLREILSTLVGTCKVEG